MGRRDDGNEVLRAYSYAVFDSTIMPALPQAKVCEFCLEFYLTLSW